MTSTAAEQERAGIELKAREACERSDTATAATIALQGYGAEIFGFLLAVHRDETAANDTFAEFAEALWKSLGSFSWSCSLRTWAYAVARNVARTARRGAGRRARREPKANESALEQVAHQVRTATLTFLRTETRSKFDVLKDALSPEDRALLVLRVDRGLAWNDLARVLVESDSDDLSELDDAAIAKEAARLRKRFQLVKERLREMAKKEGIRT